MQIYGAGFDDRDPEWRRPPSRTVAHAIALIVAGKLVYRIDGQTIRLGKGDMLYIPAGRVREAHHVDDDYHQKYWATFLVGESEEHPLPMLTGQGPLAVRTRQYEYMKQRFAQLVQQWMGKLPYHGPICAAIAADMLGRLNREADASRHPTPQQQLIADIQDYVLAHYRDNIRVEQLAAQAGRSPNYLSTLFVKLTGHTLKRYIHEVKLSAARDLIFHRNLSIREAAEYVGFCDQAYFNRVFRKMYGVPPSAMLKERERRQRELS